MAFLRDGSKMDPVPEDPVMRRQLLAEVDFFQLAEMRDALVASDTPFRFNPMGKHKCITLTNNNLTLTHGDWYGYQLFPSYALISYTIQAGSMGCYICT